VDENYQWWTSRMGAQEFVGTVGGSIAAELEALDTRKCQLYAAFVG